MSSTPKEVAADASFLINLIATGNCSELTKLTCYSFLVPREVFDEVRRDREQLDSIITDGRARLVDLDASAASHYVEAAAIVDDGEAATIALGLARQIDIATDDACASNYWHKCGGHLGLRSIGICDLLRSVEHQIEPTHLRQVLECVRRGANFEPPRQHALWWKQVMSS